MKLKIFFMIIITLLTGTLHASDFSFQIGSAPLGDPKFEDQQWYISGGGRYLSLKADQVDLEGGGADFIFRYSFFEVAAVSLFLNFSYLKGEMPPYVDAFIVNKKEYTPVVEGKGKGTLDEFSDGVKFELLPLDLGWLQFIVFGGFELGTRKIEVETPYHAEYNGIKLPSTKFRGEALRTTYGLLGGVQGGVIFGPLKILPYYNLNYRTGGTNEFVEDSGYPSLKVGIGYGSIRVEPLMVHTAGADIILYGVSLGGFFQRGKVKSSGAKAYDLLSVHASYTF